MRLLLFFVSLLFSSIFYSFYKLLNWQTILWKNSYTSDFNSIFNYFWIDSSFWIMFFSILFLTIAIFFVFYFSPIDINKNNKITYKKSKIFYLLFYIILLTPVYFWLFNYDFLILILLLLFIVSDFCFFYLPNLSFFKKYELNLKYFGLISNYLVWIVSIFYIHIIDYSYYLWLIILFSIFFNFYVHKNFTNYISLIYAILLIIFFVLYFVLKLIDLYILLFW